MESTICLSFKNLLINEKDVEFYIPIKEERNVKKDVGSISYNKEIKRLLLENESLKKELKALKDDNIAIKLDIANIKNYLVQISVNKNLGIEKFIDENSGKNVIVNATVLFKIPLVKKMDAIVFVDCPWFIRLWRARKRDGMKIRQILARFSSQKKLYASYLNTGVKVIRISNYGCKKRLQKKVSRHYQKMIE